MEHKSLAHVEDMHEAIYIGNSAVDGMAVEILLKEDFLCYGTIISNLFFYLFFTISSLHLILSSHMTP